MLSVARPPYLLRKIYSKCVWRMPENQQKIYLTFDDGPVPHVTPWVLEQLNHFNIKATFFCVGDNVLKHPEIYKQILAEGHQTANHTFNHLKGFSKDNQTYFSNVEECAALVKSNLFRPPYGQLKFSQQKYLSKKYKIIMWDVLSYDYSQNTSKERCLHNVTKNVRNGSIIVFHDSNKAFPNLEYALPASIEYLLKQGFTFSLF